MTHEDIAESVISLLAVDGELNTREKQFFLDLCQRLEVSKETMTKFFTRVGQGKGRIHLPESEADQKRLLYFLVQGLVADGKVSPKERQILNTIADKMDIAKEHVDRFIRLRLKEIKTERYTPTDKPQIECPKCGYEQPQGYRCKRCGIIFEKYQQFKKPTDEKPTDEDRLRALLSSSNILKEGKNSSTT
ncbi:hypothetical protein GF339_08280 [candidate division KSB3 bacterium]|uniref:Co-chaperone DjlA N-terminal domain-containing protein n=1 Tax=candidate division KSB3 bacterium TaxID=2044937 RepID=A0A9D5Q5P7_9BACT|nr:hypothetical protein [candidate division KSB3 bacterium]MBD3324568.1 hypothetical protein [candidate division KSB3 bacterium]